MSRRVVLVDGAHYMFPGIRTALGQVCGPLSVTKDMAYADVVIYSIFGSQHKRAPLSAVVILVCGEPGSTAKYRYDLLVDCKWTGQPRSIYFPLWIWSFGERRRNSLCDLLRPTAPAATRRPLFCAFMYRQQHAYRNDFFDVLNKSKRVDALGKQRHNVTTTPDRTTYNANETFYDTAVRQYRKYRFVICMENSSHKGYVTEKIVNAMLAGCIPIYWGAPDIASHFNPASFIHVKSREDFDEAVSTIMRLDNDPVAYAAMLAEPWFRDGAFPQWCSPDYLKSQFDRYRGTLCTKPKRRVGGRRPARDATPKTNRSPSRSVLLRGQRPVRRVRRSTNRTAKRAVRSVKKPSRPVRVGKGRSPHHVPGRGQDA